MADTQIGVRLSLSGDAQVAEAAGRASRAIEGIGRAGQVSAAQTAAALRTLPAQFTDIATSLAGGQSPLTVLLQQGGQIKDSFGGVGAAARAMGGYIAGLVSPVSVAAVALGTLATAAYAGAQESQRLAEALILSGNAAGVTVGQLQAMAQSVAALGGGSQGRAAEALGKLAATGQLAAEQLEDTAAAAIALERAGGASIDETARKFTDLGRDPLKTLVKLNEAEGFLTRAVYDQVRALEEQGRMTDAARVAQEAYRSATATVTGELEQNLGTIQRAWRGIKEGAAEAWNAMLRIGREKTTEDQLAAAERQLKSLRDGMANFGGDAERLRLIQAQDAALVAQIGTLRAAVLAEREAAAAQGASVQATRAYVKAQQEKKAVTVKDPKLPDYKDAEAAARAYMAALTGLAGITLEADARAQGLSKTQARLREIQADPAWANYSRQQRERIIMDAAAAQAAEDLATGTKIAADAAKEYGKHLDQLERGSATVRSQVQALRDEEDGARLAASGRMSLREAIEDVTIARLRDQQVAAMGNPDAVAAIQREIDARIELRGLIAGQEQRKASETAARDAQRDWARAAEQIEQSLADALMAGGKSGAEYIKGLFRTMVLRPIISAVIGPVAGAVTGALGLAGSASAAAGSGGLSAMGNIASLGSLAAGAGAFGTGVASGLSAWGAGGSVTGLLGTGMGGVFSGGLASGLGTLAGALGPIALGVGALAGAWNSLFGRKLKQSGIEGTISSDGFDGNSFQFYKGGLFRSNKTKRSPLDETTADALDTASKAIGNSTRAYAEALGLPVQAIAGFTQRIKLNLKGLSQEASKAAIEKAFAGFGEAMAQRFAGALVGVAQAGESASATLQRLATSLGSVNGIRESLGQSALAQSVSGGASASALLSTFGGLEAFAAAAEGYLAAVYSESDRLAIAQRGLEVAFGRLGQSVPASAAAYRDLVDAQDLSTDAGRSTYAALVQLAPAFAEVTAAAQQAAAEQTAAYQQALQEQAAAAARVADERAGLERQLLELQGDTAALREREIAALDPANQALQRRIYALQDERRRMEELASAGQGISAFLRDLAGGDGASQASLTSLREIYQADLAAARAGDAQASGRIPASARALLEAVRNNAATALEVAQESSRIASQLQGLPATAAYQGQAVSLAPLDVSAPVGTFAGNQVGAGTGGGVVDELRNLRQQIQDLQAAAQATAVSTNKTTRQLQELIDRGVLVHTDADAPLATVAA